MPKIIPDIENRILSAARDRLLAHDCRDFSMRAIAADCGISAGSIYNYYRSKNALAAAVMLDEWKQVLTEMNACAEKADSYSAGMEAIRKQAAAFIDRYRNVWHLLGNGGGTVESQNRRHTQMIQQIMKPVAVLNEKFAIAGAEKVLRLLSEMVLAAALRQDIDPAELKQMCGYIEKENH